MGIKKKKNKNKTKQDEENKVARLALHLSACLVVFAADDGHLSFSSSLSLIPSRLELQPPLAAPPS